MMYVVEFQIVYRNKESWLHLEIQDKT